jgi:holo-[acyl-carrier protein] synthase
MKTVGIGVDIIDNKRFKKLIKDKKFINRIFSKKEISASKKKLNKINFFSNRFAAKESFAKALGTGFRNKLNFKDIEIVNDKLGKPFYLINNKIKQIIKKIKKLLILNCFFQFLMKKITQLLLQLFKKFNDF